jgi:hypothetical protein
VESDSVEILKKILMAVRTHLYGQNVRKILVVGNVISNKRQVVSTELGQYKMEI